MPKFNECNTCWRHSDLNQYCESCTKPEGVVFPTFYVKVAGMKKTIAELLEAAKEVAEVEAKQATPIVSDGSTADYYVLPEGAEQLQDLIAFKNMNAQLGEIFRAAYRYGQCAHSNKVRELNKIIFYAEAELNRLNKYESTDKGVLK